MEAGIFFVCKTLEKESRAFRNIGNKKYIYIFPTVKSALPLSVAQAGILIYSWLDPLLGFCALVLPSKIGFWGTWDCHPPLLQAQANQLVV